jgi:hypothetical protein
MRSPSWSSDRLQIAVVACTAAATIAGLVHLPAELGTLHEHARANSQLSYTEREFAGGNGIVLEQEALYQARARIPPDATYRVETGDRLGDGAELTLPFIANFSTYFLLPRRPDDDARWIVCYGCDLSRYGPRARVLWRHEPGIAIARLVG